MSTGFVRMTGAESGFTLIELVIAVTILFAVSIALLAMVMAGQTWATRVQERENLVNYTAGYMERIRGLSYYQIGTGPSADPTGSVTATSGVVGVYTVQVTPTIVWVDDPAVPGTHDYKRVTLAATAHLTAGGSDIATTLESIVSSVGVR